jgi:hypothetical protein
MSSSSETESQPEVVPLAFTAYYTLIGNLCETASTEDQLRVTRPLMVTSESLLPDRKLNSLEKKLLINMTVSYVERRTGTTMSMKRLCSLVCNFAKERCK